MTAIVDILSNLGATALPLRACPRNVLIIVNTKKAITWLLQNMFQKFKTYSLLLVNKDIDKQ